MVIHSSLETEIRQLLIEHGDPAVVADALLPRWDANVLSSEDVRTLTRFLVNSHQLKPLFSQCLRNMKRDQPLPWAALIEAIKLTRVEIEPIEIDAIFEGIEFQEDGLDDLVESDGLDAFDPRPAKQRIEKMHRLQQAHEEKREDLRRRLDYARVNRLLSQERKVLDEIQAFDPDDPILKKEQNEFAFREAQIMVEDALAHSPPKAELERKFDQLPDDLKKAAKPILKELKRRATTATESELYDMALMLLFMDLHGESAKLIENRRLSPRLDWLLLEVLILGRQYASALGEVENLELKYAGDPETPFALTYARARALWGLGDTVTAIELMRSLTRVRPSYRSASTLLQQWIEEAP
ncbi:MAG: hypothetical protein JNJ49_12135 [Bdellovibrionaceae bacterium]|nr:hypothetical protein [Pseudobdellovibrionaceae bacterium]